MRYETEQIGGALVVKLYGEIDQHCVSEIRDDIDRQIAIRNINSLIVDLGRYKNMVSRGGKMMLVRPQPQVDKVLELSGIKKLFEKNCG